MFIKREICDFLLGYTYTPNDIMPPENASAGVVKNTDGPAYAGAFGGFRREIIAGRFVAVGQKVGKWAALPERDLSAVLTEWVGILTEEQGKVRGRIWLNEMANDGFLVTENGNGYRLSETAIEKLVQRFPARK